MEYIVSNLAAEMKIAVLSRGYSLSERVCGRDIHLSSYLEYGTGIQMPLKFLGYGSEVNLVLKSYYGFQEDQTSCIPYLINIRYFKPEY